jgi:hypothetical protein
MSDLTPLPAADRPLNLRPADGGYVLHDGDVPVGSLRREGGSGSGATVTFADGAWRFAGGGMLRPRVTVTDAASGGEAAVLRTKGVTGAHVVVEVGGRELDARAEGKLSDRWTVSDGDTVLVEVRGGAGAAHVARPSGEVEPVVLAIALYGAVQSAAAAAASAAT